MKRVIAIAACGLSLAACSGMPGWMQLDTPDFMKTAPVTTNMQFESEPAGAEARTSLGQSCRTPCSLAMTPSEFTVSFALPGYQPQTVPVKVVSSGEEEAHLVPNPVFVELQSTAPPARKKPVANAKKKPAPKPASKPAAAATAAPTAMAPQAAPSPAPAPASPWPPAR
jgi:hypothetical protein